MTPDWATLFAPRPLGERAVQLSLPRLPGPVWFASARAADLRELPSEMFLTEAESARAAEFKFGQPRENFALGRLAGKLALGSGLHVGASSPLTPALSPDGGAGEELARRLRSFEIGNGERGEPVVRASDLSLAASLSHVNGLGVAVTFPADTRVGLDLELIDAKRAETVRKGVPLSVEEERWLASTALPEATALLLLWTAREALGKALGIGLACKWDSLALKDLHGEPERGFTGGYLHHPSFRCWTWIGSEAVLTLAAEASAPTPSARAAATSA